MSRFLDSFSSIVSWRLKKTGFASGKDGENADPAGGFVGPSPRCPTPVLFLPKPILWGRDTCHSRARWGPGPTHERASVGSAILRVNPLPLGGCWLSFVLQLQTKPQVRSSQVSADSVILSGVYWKRRFHPFFLTNAPHRRSRDLLGKQPGLINSPSTDLLIPFGQTL